MKRITEAGLERHLSAEVDLFENAAIQTCVTSEDFTAAAYTLGWDVQALPTPVGDSLYDPALPQTLHISVQPGIPFGKLDFRIYQFNANGCIATRQR